MADLTRERIAELREFFGPRTDGCRCEVEWDTMNALLSMAERAVSEETVKRYAMHERLMAKDASFVACESAWDDFLESVERDLKPAAESLAKGTK